MIANCFGLRLRESVRPRDMGSSFSNKGVALAVMRRISPPVLRAIIHRPVGHNIAVHPPSPPKADAGGIRLILPTPEILADEAAAAAPPPCSANLRPLPP